MGLGETEAAGRELKSMTPEESEATGDIILGYRTAEALADARPPKEIEAALRAWKESEREKNERAGLRAEILLAKTLIRVALQSERNSVERMREAATHLQEILARRQRSGIVELEPEVLLLWARHHLAAGETTEALHSARDALALAERYGHRLMQADIHCFLAALRRGQGQGRAALEHARAARDLAVGDNPDFAYRPALEEAESLLAEMSEGSELQSASLQT